MNGKIQFIVTKYLLNSDIGAVSEGLLWSTAHSSWWGSRIWIAVTSAGVVAGTPGLGSSVVHTEHATVASHAVGKLGGGLNVESALCSHEWPSGHSVAENQVNEAVFGFGNTVAELSLHETAVVLGVRAEVDVNCLSRGVSPHDDSTTESASVLVRSWARLVGGISADTAVGDDLLLVLISAPKFVVVGLDLWVVLGVLGEAPERWTAWWFHHAAMAIDAAHEKGEETQFTKHGDGES